MRTSVAFFAGAGTILAAIGLGLGGGFTVASIVSPHPEKQKATLVDRRKLDDVARAETAQQAPVPYLAATVSATNSPAVTAPAALIGSGAAVPSAPPTSVAQPAARIDAAAEPSAKPVDTKTTDARQDEGAAAKSAATAQQPVKSERSSSASDANARVRDADVKRLSDRRKAERRQQWADRQPSEDRRQWGDRQQGDRQWSDRRIYRDRHDDEVRDDRNDYVDRRDDFDPPVRIFGSPRLGIFGPED